MAANITDSSSLEMSLKLDKWFATSPSRNELPDSLPRHLRDCNITDLQKEYASHHKQKVRCSTSEGEKGNSDVPEEKFEHESSEKQLANKAKFSLRDTKFSVSKSQTTPTPSKNNCTGTAHCFEPILTLGHHHVLAKIRTIWTDMWTATNDDALASG